MGECVPPGGGGLSKERKRDGAPQPLPRRRPRRALRLLAPSPAKGLGGVFCPPGGGCSSVGRRPRPGAGEPRLPGRDVERDRPVQGRPALPPDRLPGHAEVPGVRAGLQERAHHAAAGRRQGRRRLRPQGQERARGDALLPGVHDRAPPPHRAEHRRAGGRHRRRQPRDRLPVRPVQAHHERVHRRAHRQGAGLGRLADPARGDRLRHRVLRPGDARDSRRFARGQDLPRLGPATSPSTPWRSCSTWGQGR